jgi:serine/threonine-protein kinase
MNERPDPERTVDESPSDLLDAGMAVAFGPDSGPPLPAAGSVVRALGAAPVQLREPATEPGGPVVRPHSDAVPAEAPARLQLHGEIARGGMGAVLKGRDTDLGREVAVKVLLEAHQGRTELVQRFVEEAQVAGQLQHPGVVPVYEMGQLPDKRPYFTMKLVKGQTLAKLLAQRTDAAQDRPRLLKVFEQVCQAVAYAHARGVIHRDLKPSNVMVGAFGEVQVMDWGLAKVLRPGGAADQKAPATAEATVIRTARSGSAAPAVSGSQTQAGQVLGTPAYMAPEQARGEVAALDERCDVFGLGAILCHILTGLPPYAGADANTVYGLASRAELSGAFARLGGCGADAGLIALAKRCLCADPPGRPRDAGALAAELNAYLGSVEDRLRRAELEQAAAEARAVEERKRRRVSLALAAAVLALVAAGAGSGLWVQHQAAQRRAEQARREAEQRQMVEAALDKAAGLREQAHWREAQAVLGQARQALGEAGPEDLRHRLDGAEAELALVNRLDAIRQRRATTIVAGHFDGGAAAREYAAVFRGAGLGEAGENPGAVAARVRASGVAGPLVAALDDWASVAGEPEVRSWLLEVGRRADPDPWGDRFRDPGAWRDRGKLRALADEALRDGGAKLGELSPQLLAALASLLGGGADALPLLRAAQRRYPDDFWLSLQLANALHTTKWDEEALGYCRVAVALRPDSAAAHSNLGLALYDKKDVDGAISEYRTAIDLDPKFAHAHTHLGSALRVKRDLEGAIAEHRAAIALDPQHAIAYNNLGLALHDKKDLAGAVAAYHRAIALDPKWSAPHYNLGRALFVGNDPDGAIAEYRKAIDLEPNGAAADVHYGLGRALYFKNDLDGAIAEYRKAIDLDPKYASAHGALGQALLRQGRFAEARAPTRRCLELLPEGNPTRQVAAAQLQQCERLAPLEAKVPAVLGGQAEPAGAAERLALAQFCGQYKRLHAAAARLYAAAFAADPRLAADLRQQDRYNAACSAALAATGRGEDAKALPDKARLMLRRQALAWLRDDLAAYRQMAQRGDGKAGEFVRQSLAHWQQDADLAPVRDRAALDRLPDDERDAWRRMWADVQALLKQVQDKK